MVEAFATNNTSTGTSAALRLPPHSTEAEQSLLGGLMLDQRAWDQVADAVASNDFKARHGHNHDRGERRLGQLEEERHEKDECQHDECGVNQRDHLGLAPRP